MDGRREVTARGHSRVLWGFLELFVQHVVHLLFTKPRMRPFELGHFLLEVSLKGGFESSLVGMTEIIESQRGARQGSTGTMYLGVFLDQPGLSSYAPLVGLGVDDLESFQHIVQPGGFDMNVRLGLEASLVRCRGPGRCTSQSTSGGDSSRSGRSDVLLLLPRFLRSSLCHWLGRQARFLLGEQGGLFSLFTFGLGSLFFGLVGFRTVFGSLGPFFGFLGFDLGRSGRLFLVLKRVDRGRRVMSDLGLALSENHAWDSPRSLPF